jgi:hypothetical protein
MDERERIAMVLIDPEIRDNPLSWIVPPGPPQHESAANQHGWRCVLALADAVLAARPRC